MLAVLLWYFKRAKHKGNVFAMYLALYGVGRFFIEGLRTDSLWLIPGVIRVSQLLSAVLVVLGTAYLFVMHFRPVRAVHYYGVYSLGYKKPEKGEEAKEDVNLAEEEVVSEAEQQPSQLEPEAEPHSAEEQEAQTPPEDEQSAAKKTE